MTEPLAFLNGQLLPQSQARLALNDAGFVLGATVTDLCRTFRHRLYRWDDHLTRFRRSARSAFIDVAVPDAAIPLAAEQLIEHNAKLIGPNDDLALVMFATPGPIGFYLGEATLPGEQPTFGMHTFPLPFARYRPWVERGVDLITPSIRAVPIDCVDPTIKQRSRMHWWLAEREVRQTHPTAQALLLDDAGCVTETASSNLLLVKDGMLLSPPREKILPGVSLAVVAELCVELGISLTYRDLSLADCYAADEALLTCTTYCIAGVRSINGHSLTCPGPTLARLLAAWSTKVGVDIHQQIRAV